mmetsp:Transcript_18066/g.23320  ORF Transcript_18066/g.23320 Transcript_18066/m.23320 type:complete len:550 (-) Transcript_18066:150-1799(-)
MGEVFSSSCQKDNGVADAKRTAFRSGSNGTAATTSSEGSQPRPQQAGPVRFPPSTEDLTRDETSSRFSRRTLRLLGASFKNSHLKASDYNEVHQNAAYNLQYNGLKRSKSKRMRPVGVVGLNNMGNTCFFNSSLQCLSATIPLTDYFLGYNYKAEINKDNVLGTKGKLATAYANLMSSMWSGKQLAIRPFKFKSELENFAPQFQGSEQHDAQEMLALLLDGIHEDLNRVKKKPYIEDRDCAGKNDEQDAMEAWKNYLSRSKSIIVDIFQGQMRSCLTCLVCGHSNVRFEPFMYLSLPMADSCESLEDCMELYLAPEKLSGENQWYCSHCKTHVNAMKKTDIWILPPILIVHLKRFRFDDFGNAGCKNEAPIDYPIRDWDLRPYVKSRAGVSARPSYDLYAVSNHHGGLGGGHYTAYAKSRLDEESWYGFNDSRTTPISERTLKSNQSSAYLLFYNRSSQPTSGRDDNGFEDTPPPSQFQRIPLVRRQSTNRPDLWPHTQVQDMSHVRSFTRSSVRVTDVPSAVLEDEPGEQGSGAIELELENPQDVRYG